MLTKTNRQVIHENKNITAGYPKQSLQITMRNILLKFLEEVSLYLSLSLRPRKFTFSFDKHKNKNKSCP